MTNNNRKRSFSDTIPYLPYLRYVLPRINTDMEHAPWVPARHAKDDLPEHENEVSNTDDNTISIIDVFNYFFYYTHTPASAESSPRQGAQAEVLRSDSGGTEVVQLCSHLAAASSKSLGGIRDKDIKTYFRALEYGLECPLADVDPDSGLHNVHDSRVPEPLFGHFVDITPPSTPTTRYNRISNSPANRNRFATLRDDKIL